MKLSALTLLIALGQSLLAADVGFILKPTPQDKAIGSTAIPQIQLGAKTLADVPLLISNTGGLNLWIRHADGTGTIKPISLSLEQAKGEKTAFAKVGDKELSEKVPVEKQALKAMAWLLIQRYPKQEYTRAFLQKYFHVSHPATMTEEEKLALNRPSFPGFSNPLDKDHGLGAGGLPFKAGRELGSTADAPTLEQLESFYAHPEEWAMAKDGVCTEKGCAIEHSPAKGEPALGSMLASKGMKQLMISEDDFQPAKPLAAPKTASSGHREEGQRVSSQAEFETAFKAAKETEALVLFTADNCGPCQTLHADLASGAKKVPAGTKLFVVNVRSYSWSTLPPEVKTFKGAAGFPHVLKYTKGANGELSKSYFSPGDTSSFR